MGIPLPPPPAVKSKTKRRKAGRKKSKAGSSIDSSVGQAEWDIIYRLYNSTGDPIRLAEISGFSVEAVEHIIFTGIKRLGLPPVHKYAIDQRAVVARMQTIGAKPKLVETNKMPLPPEHQEQITNRVAQEAVAANAFLNSAMRGSAVFFDWVTEMHNRLKDGSAVFDVPEAISIKHLKEMAETGQKLAQSIDIAIRLARLTTGEPEHTLSIEIAHKLESLTDEEVIRLAKTGRVPPQLVGRTQSIIDIDEMNKEENEEENEDERDDLELEGLEENEENEESNNEP
jgi:hypothetical protein